MLRIIVAAVATFLFVGLLPAAPAHAGDIERMQGEWVISAIQVAGQTAQAPQQTRIAFSGNVAISKTGDQEVQRSQVQVNDRVTPRQIDIVPMTPGAKKMIGIYEFLDEGTLVICAAQGDAARPKEIQTTEGDGAVILYLQPARQ